MSPDYLDIRLQGRRDKLLVWSEPHRQQKKNLSVVNGICTVTFALVWSEPHRQKKTSTVANGVWIVTFALPTQRPSATDHTVGRLALWVVHGQKGNIARLDRASLFPAFCGNRWCCAVLGVPGPFCIEPDPHQVTSFGTLFRKER